MSLPVLRKIRDLVNAGAAVVGPKPHGHPQPERRSGGVPHHRRPALGHGSRGKGKVYAGQTVAQALAAMQVAPDFEYSKPQPDTNLLFVHRKLPDGEIYWVNNRDNRERESWTPRSACTGKAAEIWHPETGKIEPASYRIADGRTTVPLQPGAGRRGVRGLPQGGRGAVAHACRRAVETALATVEGPWDVSFQPDRGAPAKITLDRLSSWHENPDPGVKYFSGTGTYTKTIQAPADWFKTGAQLVARSGRREEPGGGDGQRQAARHPLEDAVPGGCDRRPEARRQHA